MAQSLTRAEQTALLQQINTARAASSASGNGKKLATARYSSRLASQSEQLANKFCTGVLKATDVQANPDAIFAFDAANVEQAAEQFANAGVLSHSARSIAYAPATEWGCSQVRCRDRSLLVCKSNAAAPDSSIDQATLDNLLGTTTTATTTAATNAPITSNASSNASSNAGSRAAKTGAVAAASAAGVALPLAGVGSAVALDRVQSNGVANGGVPVANSSRENVATANSTAGTSGSSIEDEFNKNYGMPLWAWLLLGLGLLILFSILIALAVAAATAGDKAKKLSQQMQQAQQQFVGQSQQPQQYIGQYRRPVQFQQQPLYGQQPIGQYDDVVGF